VGVGVAVVVRNCGEAVALAELHGEASGEGEAERGEEKEGEMRGLLDEEVEGAGELVSRALVVGVDVLRGECEDEGLGDSLGVSVAEATAEGVGAEDWVG